MKASTYKISIIIILIIVGIVLVLKSCNKDTTNDLTDYKEAFIEANTEIGCAIKNKKNITEAEIKEISTQSFKKWKLPYENNSLSIEILKYFEDDKDSLEQISENIKNC